MKKSIKLLSVFFILLLAVLALPMAIGSMKIGSKTYNFNSSGACLNP